MASMTIRQFDDELKQKLRGQVALHGWSMEEVRVVLHKALQESSLNEIDLAQLIHQRFAMLGGAICS